MLNMFGTNMARGNTLADFFKIYMKLLLSACSTYDMKNLLQESPCRNYLNVPVSGDDGHNPFDFALDGEFALFNNGLDPFDDIMDEGSEGARTKGIGHRRR
jgi:hypothetical protein